MASTAGAAFETKEYPVPAGSHPHDVALALANGVERYLERLF